MSKSYVQKYLYTYINNCYVRPARLFITGGEEIHSNEGTTQGDPIAMGMYALGLMPLLSTIIKDETCNLLQVALADDLTGIGTIPYLKEWWRKVLQYGPYLGYHVKEAKSWLITKENHLNSAKESFKDFNIKITTDGHRHLGAVVGTRDNKEKFVKEKVIEWVRQINKLSEFACTQPHAAFSAFIHGLRHRYTYVMRTIPNVSILFKPLDFAIETFIKVLFQGYAFNVDERTLYSLPARLGGMGLIIPSKISDQEYENSREITKSTIEHVIGKTKIFKNNSQETTRLKGKIKNEKRKQSIAVLNELKTQITCKFKLRSIEAAGENGASIWLTVIPVKRYGFFLEKQAFWDAIRIRYNVPMERIPITCVCNNPFDLQHALSCPKGGMVIARHNELRNLTAEILSEICTNVVIEPTLTQLTGETFSYATANTSNEARADVSARGFWIKGQTAFCDVRVFNPIAKCNLNQSLPAAHKKNENEKKRQYNQRVIEVEHGSFSPLVFTPYGGNGREAERFIAELAEKLAERKKISYNVIIHWLRAKLSFNLTRSAVLCLRGSRKSKPDMKTDFSQAEISNAIGKIK